MRWGKDDWSHAGPNEIAPVGISQHRSLSRVGTFWGYLPWRETLEKTTKKWFLNEVTCFCSRIYDFYKREKSWVSPASAGLFFFTWFLSKNIILRQHFYKGDKKMLKKIMPYILVFLLFILMYGPMLQGLCGNWFTECGLNPLASLSPPWGAFFMTYLEKKNFLFILVILFLIRRKWRLLHEWHQALQDISILGDSVQHFIIISMQNKIMVLFYFVSKIQTEQGM